ncbi:glycosyltransferase [Paenibacillus rigui]|uniref:Glycosyl transferase family 1 n=1 Tax=Paenibacillus rigui TaxID=554312 RepID=A0A229UQ71_9BACL|nr:glycosyltransferase [Paenibacillus rigui]OXM85636.1 hypothetical protein CF651_14720 [Paenibacillus rigui]
MCIVIYPPTINWNYMKQRPQQLMEQFGKHGHTVYYYDKHNTEGPVLEETAPHVFVIRHAAYFQHQLYPQVSAGHKKLLWSTWSRKIAFAAQVQADYIVYDCVDDFPEWEQEEQSLAGKADVIFCTADHLFTKMRQLVKDKPVVSVPNGCDWEHFAPVALSTYCRAQRLYDLPPTKGPKLGYIGAWAPWVDEEWIRYTAKHMPDAQIVIVGPLLREDTGPLGPNVHLLGYKDYEELPYILSYFDVCIIPFRLNRITVSTNPIKVYEFLAAGKPVVSTLLPELQKLLPHVKTTGTPEAFVASIREALTENAKDRLHAYKASRSSFARQFSWQARYEVIARTLNAHIKSFSPASPQAPEIQSLPVSIPYSTSFELQHCTMNSYYPELNLKNDPVLVGKLEAGQYQCMLKPPAEALPEDIGRMYLEFDGYSSSLPHAEVTLSIVKETWALNRLTFANQPPSQIVHTFRLDRQQINETVSLDITELIPAFGRKSEGNMSIHLSGSNGLVRLTNPKLTVITTSEIRKRKG